MPITKARSTGCDQICSKCEAERTIDYASISAGMYSAESGRTDPNCCRLPPCPTCGAVECLIRTWDNHPDPQNHSAKHSLGELAKILGLDGGAVERLLSTRVEAAVHDLKVARASSGAATTPGAALPFAA